MQTACSLEAWAINGFGRACSIERWEFGRTLAIFNHGNVRRRDDKKAPTTAAGGLFVQAVALTTRCEGVPVLYWREGCSLRYELEACTRIHKAKTKVANITVSLRHSKKHFRTYLKFSSKIDIGLPTLFHVYCASIGSLCVTHPVAE